MQPGPPARTDSITIFVTGDELGAMKPCGCSGGQFGGLDRRAAVLDRAPEHGRLIIDTGHLIAGDGEQDLLKFSTIIQAFRLLGYDVLSLGRDELETAANLGLLKAASSDLAVISAGVSDDSGVPATHSRRFSLKGTPVLVTVAAFDVGSAAVDQIDALFEASPGLLGFNILILSRCDEQLLESLLSAVSSVDCIVCPADSDDPGLISGPDDRPLVFSAGRYGRYVNKLEVTADGQTDKLNLKYSPVDVNEDLKPKASLANLYKAYQRLVKEEGLLERHSRFPLPGGLEYTGSQSCKDCHKYEYGQWATKAHADAYATLEKVSSDYDPECVVCHVVGMDYESGFLSAEKTPHLKNVGCENCHGPGSEHARNPVDNKTSAPKSACVDCHTPEHSVQYAQKKTEYLEKIVHWKEPDPPPDVK